jgi:hypothetical protein
MKPTEFSTIHPMTSTVWPARKRPVPRKRATASDIRPNASESWRHNPAAGADPRPGRPHRAEEPLPVLRGHLGQQVRGVVGLHFLDDVRGALKAEACQQPDLVLLGHLLEQVSQLLVPKQFGELAAAGGGHGLDRVGHIRRVYVPQLGELVGEAAGLEQLAVLVPGHDLGRLAAQAPAPADGQR